MNWTEAQDAFNTARATIYCVDSLVGKMAALIVGRLRIGSCDASVLTALKKELAGWDMHRREWK